MEAKAVRWLSEGEAADLYFDGEAPPASGALKMAGLADAPLDLVIQPAASRAKKLVVADMDSTIIEQECIDEIAVHFGLGEKIAPITRAAMEGKLDFASALRKRVALLEGVPVAALAEVRERRISYSQGAATLAATLKAQGIAAALVSGGFTLFVDHAASELGFGYALSNTLEIEGGKLTGKVKEPVVDGAAKRDFLNALSEKLGLARGETLALGDGANDIPMMGAAGFSIAYRAKPKAEAAAKASLRHSSLEGVLFTLGIPRRDFAA